MAFCKYCGRKLEEGEICQCQKDAEMDNAGQNPKMKTQENYVQDSAQVTNAAMAEKTNDVKKMIVGLFDVAKGIYKNPSEQIPKQVKKATIKESACFLVIQALLSGLFAVFAISKINKLIAIGGNFTAAYKFSGLQGFALTVIYSIILAVILAALYFVMNKIVKSQMSFTEAVALTSIKAIAVYPGIVLSYVLFAINSAVGIAVFILSSFFAVFYLVYGMKNIDGMSDNKNIYISFIVLFVFLIVFLVFAKMVIMSYVPATIKSSLSGLDFSSLLEEFM